MAFRLRLADWLSSRGPKVLGLCQSDVDGNAAVVNEIVQRLLVDPNQPDEGWFGTYARMAFQVTRDNPYITFPREVARPIAIDLCKRPILIRNEWFEFLSFGNGLRGGCGSVCEPTAAFTRGDVGGTVVTAFDFRPPNKIIRAYITNAADVGKHILIQGKDQFGAPVTSTDGTNLFSGEFLTFAQPFVENSEEMSALSGIQKDLTVGQVQVFEVSTETQEQRLLLIMEPGEEVASYSRVYLNNIPGACCHERNYQVTAMCKLGFVPVRVVTDYILIGCLPALISEAAAIRYSGMDSGSAKKMEGYHHNQALSFLAGELDHNTGKTNISVAVPLWNGDRMRRMPV